MTNNRVIFFGNPWPEGHPIKNFIWSAEQRGSEVWFRFHLETADYNSERDIDDDENLKYLSDWNAPIVWNNYHSCTISSDFWHEGGFFACSLADFSIEQIDGLSVHVDPLPLDLSASYEDRAFHIYLLGHDSVADHHISFNRVPGTDLFDIEWLGKLALTYAGDYIPRHSFRAEIKRVRLPAIKVGA